MLTSPFHPRLIFLQPSFRRSFASRRHRHDIHPTTPLITPLKKPNEALLKPNPNEAPPLVDTISNALRDVNAADNNLLAPVHIPEDPDGVLNEKHPAAHILANSAIVVQRQLELMNILAGFEQANKYVIMDPQGNHLGFIAERDLGMGNMVARQMFSTHRSFTTHVFDKFEKEVLRFHRPFSWISSKIGVYDPLEVGSTSLSSSKSLQSAKSGPLSTEIRQSEPQVSHLDLSDMRIIGEAQQQWAPLRRKYNLFLFRESSAAEGDSSVLRLPSGELPISTSREVQVAQNSPEGSGGRFDQFAYVDEPFLSWDFSLLSADSRLIGSVNRNFSGFGRELLTDTGVYALRMDAAGLASEPRHLISTTGHKNEVVHTTSGTAMTLDQRAVMLATAVTVDFDYFSRKSGGVGIMPLWFPWGGGGAAGEAAGGVAGAEAAGGVAEGAGAAARGVGGMGEGAVTGAATMAGYEAMQRGASGGGGAPTPNPSQSPGSPDAASPPNQAAPPEDVWGEQGNFWQDQGKGGGEGGKGGSSEGGGGEGWGDWSDWF